MSEHPIAAMIKEIEDLRMSEYHPFHEKGNGLNLALRIIKKHLAGGAWVDVLDEDGDCRISSIYYLSENDGDDTFDSPICNITENPCPGLGQGDWCPAFIVEGDS